MATIEDVSDTALWVATLRARESARQDAWFRDPLVEQLIGEEGPRVVRSLGRLASTSGGVIARTLAFDDFIRTCVDRYAVDTVVNLGAGLDTRPYRLDLPPVLRWWELDLPRLLDFKEARLSHEQPRCQLRRLAVDLRDRAARARALDDIAGQASRALVVTEGVLVYLDPDDVSHLARELHARSSVAFWAMDLVAHTLLDQMKRRALNRKLEQAGAAPRFAPKEGVSFFQSLGWRVLDQKNPIHDAYRLRRAPLFMRVLKPFIMATPRPGSHMEAWAKAGNVLLERGEAAASVL